MRWIGLISVFWVLNNLTDRAIKMETIKKQLHKVSAELLHLALQFAAKNDTRYYLGGVHIRAGSTGSIIEATDGHTCCILHDDSGESGDKDVIVSADIIKLLPKKGDVLIYSDESLSFNNLLQKSAFVQLHFEKALIDANYPNINRAIPSEAELSPGIHWAGFNAQYIVRAINFFAKLPDKDKSKSMLAYQKANDSTVVLFTSYDRKIIVLVMPMNTADKKKSFTRPVWLGDNK